MSSYTCILYYVLSKSPTCFLPTRHFRRSRRRDLYIQTRNLTSHVWNSARAPALFFRRTLRRLLNQLPCMPCCKSIWKAPAECCWRNPVISLLYRADGRDGTTQYHLKPCDLRCRAALLRAVCESVVMLKLLDCRRSDLHRAGAHLRQPVPATTLLRGQARRTVPGRRKYSRGGGVVLGGWVIGRACTSVADIRFVCES